MALITRVQRIPTPEPQATIDTSTQGLTPPGNETGAEPESLQRLRGFTDANGDISHLLDPAVLGRIGVEAVRQWEIDDASRMSWKNLAERSLAIAAQEEGEGTESSGYASGEGLWDNSADIHYPILTTASQQFAARAGPELVKGDSVVSVKVFMPPHKKPTPGQVAQANPPPQPAPGQPPGQPPSPQAQQAAQALAAQQQQEQQASLAIDARNARAERVKHFLNWLIFYQMDDWEGDTDLLLHQIPITGAAFKKIYMGTSGLCSEYVSALRLTVHNDTKSLYRCPRITEDFEVYPYEVEQRQRTGIYRPDVDLPKIGEDPEQPRKFIEQHRLDDLDEDGLAEPYVVTVDIDTKTLMRIEPAYTLADIMINQTSGQVMRIDRWELYAPYLFLPDPRGKFYGIGFGKLLESITDSVDTSINQLLDAGTAEIAGGGFIGSSVRLQGSGAGGSLFFQPGEYKVVSTSGPDLRNAIWERTVPHPSDVTFKLLELLLAAAKDIASVKDVITGEAPSTAPVGTTLALQNQALQAFSAIYKRVYRGFKAEFRLMYRCLKRWGTDRERRQYAELTGGDFDADFSGDGTDIQPVADPAVVTKMQKIARIQTQMQLAESEIGQAAGMTQPGPARELARDALETMDTDRPDRFFADVPPNPLMIAKTEDIAATAKLKSADAELRGAEVHTKLTDAQIKAQKSVADTGLVHAKTARELGLAAKDTHDIHKEADRIAQTGSVADLETLQPPEPPEGPHATPSPAP